MIQENLRWAFCYINIQYVFNTLINSCFMWYRHILGKVTKINVLYFMCVCGWENILSCSIQDNSCSCFFLQYAKDIFHICFLLYKIKRDFVLIIFAWFSFIKSCEAMFWEFGCNENIWCQNMFDRICLCYFVVFIHMKCQHGFYVFIAVYC